jgi:prepilin-type N-terminal cleavage/methylation domain-containing protein
MRRCKKRSHGFTLIEVLIAVTLVSLLTAGLMVAMRVGLSAMNKADVKLMSNRRVMSAHRILEQQVAGIMPVVADCQAGSDKPAGRIAFFQGESQSMRFASTYSLQQATRGVPMVLEFQVIPGANNEGVRLIVNERWYTGPRGAGAVCLGTGPDPLTGAPVPRFLPIIAGPNSYVLADKLRSCSFSYSDVAAPQAAPLWTARWAQAYLPNAIRVELAPLHRDPSQLQPVALTIPIHVNRLPLEQYELE